MNVEALFTRAYWFKGDVSALNLQGKESHSFYKTLLEIKEKARQEARTK